MTHMNINQRKGGFYMGVAKLNAIPRNEKGYKVRREQFIPGVLYGKNIEATSVKFDNNEIDRIIRQYGDRARLKIVMDEKESLGIFKEVARDILSRDVLHIDIQLVDLKEEISLNVPIILNGSDAITFKKLVLQQNLTEIQLTGRVDLIPNSIEFDVSNMDDGDTITLADVKLPEEIKHFEAEDTLIATVKTPKMADIPEEETEDTIVETAAPATEETEKTEE